MGGRVIMKFPYGICDFKKVNTQAAIPAAKRFNLFKLLQIPKNSLRRKL